MSTRKKYVIGNWKMHGTRLKVKKFVESMLGYQLAFQRIEVGFCPPFVYLPQAARYTQGSSLKLGGQNVYPRAEGAFTGEISPHMLYDVGCQYVIIGHSERRQHMGESDAFIAEKFKGAVEAKLWPILCVGETAEEREAGKTFEVVERQLAPALSLVTAEALEQVLIAYEPVWAIGTGVAAKPDDIDAVHLHIRQVVAKMNPTLAEKLPILYGGSLKAKNAAQIFGQPNVDGGLVGSASLDSEEFLSICQTAAQNTGQG